MTLTEPGASEGLALDCARLRATPATPAHAAQLQACLAGAPDYFTRTEGRPAEPGAARAMLEDAEADPSRRVFALVPRSGGPVVGVLDVHLDYPEPGTAHVGLLLFRESCQGIGYGTETAVALERALAHAGCRAVRASVGDENPTAQAFWERLGYAVVGRLERGIAVYEKGL
jgi:RimJ/RimL family protein N-acetyltransferase